MTNRNRLRKTLIVVLVIMIIMPIIIVSFSTIMGEGATLSSISATIATKRAFKAIEKADYEKAADYIGFTGYSIESKSIKDEKLRFIEGLRVFFDQEKREIIRCSDIKFNTDDGFTKGSIELEIKEGLETYYFTLSIAKQKDKIYPMSITEITTSEKSAHHAENIADELISIISTYNPG